MQERYDVYSSAYKSDSPLHNTHKREKVSSKGNTKGLLLVFRNSPPAASLLFHFPLLYT